MNLDYDRDNILETIRDPKTPTAILIKMLEIEKAEYIYRKQYLNHFRNMCIAENGYFSIKEIRRNS